MHVMEELEFYMNPEGYLARCTFRDLLNIVSVIRQKYASTEAANEALYASASEGARFFNTTGARSPPLEPPQRPADDEDGGFAPEVVVNFTDDEPEDAEDKPGEPDKDNDADAPTKPTNSAPPTLIYTYSGDMLLHNNILLLRDLGLYWEFRESVHAGDAGRTLEVIKVHHSLPVSCLSATADHPY